MTAASSRRVNCAHDWRLLRTPQKFLSVHQQRAFMVIGATNRLGEYATERPVTFQEVFATMYHNLGVDLESQRLFDFRGRPQYLIEPGVKPIAELV